jgi:hypothetical protein
MMQHLKAPDSFLDYIWSSMCGWVGIRLWMHHHRHSGLCNRSMICYLVCQCCVVLYRCPARSSAFHWQHHFPCSSKDRIWGASSRCSVLQVVLWLCHTVLGIMPLQQLNSLLVLHATSFYPKAVRNWHISCMLHVVAVLMCCPQPTVS